MICYSSVIFGIERTSNTRPVKAIVKRLYAILSPE